ncbi:MAG: class I SAM-dependent methyltransferase, partial [Pyrinomonadaceae bacterium]
KKSLELIDKTQLETDSQIIDVGGGASTLVDDLIERGFDKLTVVDLSATALHRLKKRLGEKAGSVT